jgi:hypothetical protein
MQMFNHNPAAVVIPAVVAYRLLDRELDLGAVSIVALGMRRENAAGPKPAEQSSEMKSQGELLKCRSI